MKRTFFILSSLLLFVCLFYSCQPQVDIEAAKKAIIAVNEEERDAYFDKDISKLGDIWLQDSGSKRYFTSEKSLTVLNGWTEIEANYQENFEAGWLDDYEDVKADFLNYEITISGNSAMVYHDIHWTGMHLNEPFEVNQKRILNMVNQDGTWKICLTAQMTVPVEKPDIEEEAAEESP
jgi:hypothetical protein